MSLCCDVAICSCTFFLSFCNCTVSAFLIKMFFLQTFEYSKVIVGFIYLDRHAFPTYHSILLVKMYLVLGLFSSQPSRSKFGFQEVDIYLVKPCICSDVGAWWCDVFPLFCLVSLLVLYHSVPVFRFAAALPL